MPIYSNLCMQLQTAMYLHCAKGDNVSSYFKYALTGCRELVESVSMVLDLKMRIFPVSLCWCLISDRVLNFLIVFGIRNSALIILQFNKVNLFQIGFSMYN